MTRRAKKPSLPQLLWGPQKRSYRRANQVTIVRVPAQAAVQTRFSEDLVLASVLGVTITAIIALMA